MRILIPLFYRARKSPPERPALLSFAASRQLQKRGSFARRSTLSQSRNSRGGFPFGRERADTTERPGASDPAQNPAMRSDAACWPTLHATTMRSQKVAEKKRCRPAYWRSSREAHLHLLSRQEQSCLVS